MHKGHYGEYSGNAKCLNMKRKDKQLLRKIHNKTDRTV